MIKKILVANRGEIAIRIMRTAKEMGISTVAVYSEADRNALHTHYADEAICVGGAASKDSYLVIDNIIAACRTTGADAIHPGYGFLSENAAFAQRVADEGLIFIGPSAHSMNLMGNKISAKKTAEAHNIPLVPGLSEAIVDINFAKQKAKEIGFPILIKAAAGGGGKGMRIVEKFEEFEEQMALAVSEAVSAFGDGAVFIERYVASPRHIEIQVLGDTHGNVIHLLERECSIQRRHQKVIEEAPSSVLTPAIREAMGACAVMVAKACNYVGAGTVEFILDENLDFFFLEMNTRLQVEHPVTEYVTGLDLVREMINIANGLPISIAQADIKPVGHSIELRVYAEDPANEFLPDIGTLQTYIVPQGPGIRVDDAYLQGMDIPIYYDPMIAKLIVHADTRAEAIAKMIRAIDEYKITGIATTLPFGKYVMEHEAFTSGNFDTHFVKKYFTPEKLISHDSEAENIAAMVAVMALQENKNTKILAHSTTTASSWKKNRINLR